MPLKTTVYAIAAAIYLLPTCFSCNSTSMEKENEIPESKSQTIRLLALGDSYTIGESVAEAERWPNQLKGALDTAGFEVAKPKIIATTGWRTDDLKRAINADGVKPGEYNLVSLLIGVNNQYQGKTVESYRPEFEELLKLAIDFAGSKDRVFVVSIPDYGFTPFGLAKKDEISTAIDQYNAANREITESYGIKYIDITPISREGLNDPSLVAADGLHPSGKMYGLWVEKILAGYDFSIFR